MARINRALDAQQQAKIVSLYTKDGVGTMALSERFRVSRNSVLSVLREAGVEIVAGRRSDACCGGHLLRSSLESGRAPKRPGR